MRVVVGRIVRIWPDPIFIQNKVHIQMNEFIEPCIHVEDSMITNDMEVMQNYLGAYVYLYKKGEVPNDIRIGHDALEERLNGRLVLNADGTIRIARNDHNTVGEIVIIDEA
jgi:hypothetical protein